MANDSILMRMPAEIRLLIYAHLVGTGNKEALCVQNKPGGIASSPSRERQKPRRATYYVMERSCVLRSYPTTYCLDAPTAIHTAIMAVNRKIRDETTDYLYGARMLCFGSSLEAVAPFLLDRMPDTSRMLRNVALRKRSTGIGGIMDTADTCTWKVACRALARLPRLRTLTVAVEAGRPRHAWDGPRQLSISDLRLLYSARHDCLAWVRDLAELAGSERASRKGGALEDTDADEGEGEDEDESGPAEVVIVADIRHMPGPQSSETIIFAALSASIDTTLIDFLREDLGIPARAHCQPQGTKPAESKVVAWQASNSGQKFAAGLEA